MLDTTLALDNSDHVKFIQCYLPRSDGQTKSRSVLINVSQIMSIWETEIGSTIMLRDRGEIRTVTDFCSIHQAIAEFSKP